MTVVAFVLVYVVLLALFAFIAAQYREEALSLPQWRWIVFTTGCTLVLVFWPRAEVFQGCDLVEPWSFWWIVWGCFGR